MVLEVVFWNICATTESILALDVENALRYRQVQPLCHRCLGAVEPI